jgi:SMI1-KNR4 cell-wall
MDMQIKILSFSEIASELDNLFLAVPLDIRTDLSDVLLKLSELNTEMIEKVNVILGVDLPNSFVEVIAQYDCGDLTLGDVSFGYHENYVEYLIDNNINNERMLGWWGSGMRPPKYLLIAGSDGYVILLDIDTGEIVAYPRTQSYHQSEVIASDFSIFLRAVATVYLQLRSEENKELLLNIPQLTGSASNSSFWREIIKLF